MLRPAARPANVRRNNSRRKYSRISWAFCPSATSGNRPGATRQWCIVQLWPHGRTAAKSTSATIETDATRNRTCRGQRFRERSANSSCADQKTACSTQTPNNSTDSTMTPCPPLRQTAHRPRSDRLPRPRHLTGRAWTAGRWCGRFIGYLGFFIAKERMRWVRHTSPTRQRG
jgi:hypothetical protein